MLSKGVVRQGKYIKNGGHNKRGGLWYSRILLKRGGCTLKEGGGWCRAIISGFSNANMELEDVFLVS